MQIFFMRLMPAKIVEVAAKLSRLIVFVKMQNPPRLPRIMTLERPKMLRACRVFRILTPRFADVPFEQQASESYSNVCFL